jgi:hypothetical protein
MFAKLLSKVNGYFNKSTSAVDILSDRYDVYLPNERLIYQYFDGTKMVVGDPHELYRKVGSKGAELSSNMMAARVPQSKFAEKAHKQLVEDIRNIFGIKTLAEGGLSELETTELLDHFLMFCDIIKKNSNPSTTDQEETSPSTVPPSNEAENPTTSSTWDFGSTAKDSTINSKQPSPSVPCTPSESLSQDLSSSVPSQNPTKTPKS